MGVEVDDNQLPTFDAEYRSAKIPNSLYKGIGGVGWGGVAVEENKLSATFNADTLWEFRVN